MILSCLLIILLVLQAAPSPSADACPPGDDRCKAKLFLKRAKEATTPRDRAVFTFGAHRLYLALFDKTGKDQDLCAARRTFDRSLAVKGQPQSLRKSFESQRADLTKREGTRRPRCGRGRIDRSESARIAKAPPKLMTPEPPSPPSDPASVPVTPPPVVSRVTPASTTTTTNDLTPVVVRTAATPRGLDGPPQERKRQAPPGRRLVIAGGVSLGVGLALTGVAGFMGGRMLNNWRDSRQLHDEAGLFRTDAASERDIALAKQYDRLRVPTVTTAVIGASAVIVGAVLVGVGAKRLARLASRTAILPIPGGVAFRARF